MDKEQIPYILFIVSVIVLIIALGLKYAGVG